MWRIAVGCLIVAAGFGVAATGAARSGTAPKVTVKPRTGDPRTRFVVRFRAWERTGVVGSVYRRYQVDVRGRGTGCAQSAATNVPPTRRGQRVSVKLSGPWCVATYHGKLTEIERPHCRSGQVCPAFAIELRTLGRFTFVVAGAGDIAPPTFAGLKSAVQCFPGPQTPGEERPVNLSWGAASDDQSPSAQIFYDVYMSATSGGVNFSQPSWTTQGTTSFSTPDLPPGRFFVVRARDQAGNQDHNTAERQAKNPCL
jgi:hypothetical protein